MSKLIQILNKVIILKKTTRNNRLKNKNIKNGKIKWINLKSKYQIENHQLKHLKIFPDINSNLRKLIQKHLRKINTKVQEQRTKKLVKENSNFNELKIST